MTDTGIQRATKSMTILSSIIITLNSILNILNSIIFHMLIINNIPTSPSNILSITSARTRESST